MCACSKNIQDMQMNVYCSLSPVSVTIHLYVDLHPRSLCQGRHKYRGSWSVNLTGAADGNMSVSWVRQSGLNYFAKKTGESIVEIWELTKG